MDELNNVLVGIPSSIANLDLPDPALRDFYRDEQDRIFWVTGEINCSTLDLVTFILRCNKEDAGKPVEDRKRILVMIDSPGGDVTTLASILGVMKISKTPVYTCCYCMAYSAAADLLACGHKRFALPMTSAMFHSGSAYYAGTQNEINSAKKFFDNLGKRISNEVNTRTKFDSKFLKKLKTDDIYMNEEEALQYGVIDEIVANIDELF